MEYISTAGDLVRLLCAGRDGDGVRAGRASGRGLQGTPGRQPWGTSRVSLQPTMPSPPSSQQVTGALEHQRGPGPGWRSPGPQQVSVGSGKCREGQRVAGGRGRRPEGSGLRAGLTSGFRGRYPSSLGGNLSKTVKACRCFLRCKLVTRC